MTHRERLLIVIGFLVLGAVAVWGWMRKPATTAFGSAPGYQYSNALPAMNTSVPYVDANGQPVYAGPAPGHYAAQAAVPCVEPVNYVPQAQTAVYPSYRSPRYVRTVRQPTAQYVESADRTRERAVAPRTAQGRSKGKSVAIVAGSAGVGAAIGALAGGGKGAAIGALSGGTAGFVYDRMTHKR